MEDNNSDSLHISDILEALEKTDPEFMKHNGTHSIEIEDIKIFPPETNPIEIEDIKIFPPRTMQINDENSFTGVSNTKKDPYAVIHEEPAAKAIRFRYTCEGRSAGSVPGVKSTPEKKTYPSIRIIGYQGKVQVLVSCVTKDSFIVNGTTRYKPHPHNIVGKEGCVDGICHVSLQLVADNQIITFPNLGIQCVKKQDVEKSLRVRERLKVDPFNTGFEHRKKASMIDLNAVRLCFQIFVPGPNKEAALMSTLVSDVIYDKKAVTDLAITKLSHCSANAAGGMEMMLLCSKVVKEDVRIRFYEEHRGQIIWESQGHFEPIDVHSQAAINFRVPAYRELNLDHEVQVFIQLVRPSDGETSDPVPFTYSPKFVDDVGPIERKKRKIYENPRSLVDRYLQMEGKKLEPTSQSPYASDFDLPQMMAYSSIGTPKTIKLHRFGPSSSVMAPMENHAFSLNLSEFSAPQFKFKFPEGCALKINGGSGFDTQMGAQRNAPMGAQTNAQMVGPQSNIQIIPQSNSSNPLYRQVYQEIANDIYTQIYDQVYREAYLQAQQDFTSQQAQQGSAQVMQQDPPRYL